MKATDRELKIYEFQIGGEREWVSARSLIHALQVYCSTTSMSIREFHESDEIIEVPKDKWSDYNVSDEYGVVVITFAQWMAVNKEPDMIATTCH